MATDEEAFCQGAWWAITEMIRLNGLDDGRTVRAPTYHDIIRAYPKDPPRPRADAPWRPISAPTKSEE